MNISEENNQAKFKIKSINSNKVTINDKVITQSFIISKTNLICPWQVTDALAIKPDDLKPIIEQQPSLVIIGCGAAQQILPPGLFVDLIAGNIGYEVMTSEAACRTFNLLVSDGRDVVAAVVL